MRTQQRGEESNILSNRFNSAPYLEIPKTLFGICILELLNVLENSKVLFHSKFAGYFTSANQHI